MRRLLLLCLLSVLAGCAGPQVSDYAREQPNLELSDYFNGELEAWGMFQNRSGEVVRRFHVALTGTWQGDVGTLDERFTYSDGTTQQRGVQGVIAQQHPEVEVVLHPAVGDAQYCDGFEFLGEDGFPRVDPQSG